MPNTQISFQDTGYFSKLICDYIDMADSVKNLYGNFPDISGFKNQIELKRSQFDEASRKILFSSLTNQYKELEISDSVQQNLELLKLPDTFTVVTGHQLNIFTGPLYFLYKIVSAINLAKKLKEEFPSNNFVPVYWMATEDHDFEEINHFYVNDKKINWNISSSGPVGRKSTENIETAFEEFCEEIGTNNNANYLKTLFKKAYLEHQTLTGATRFLVNELFGEYGLVIIDGDDRDLKNEFSPYVEKELFEQYAHKSIAETNVFLEKNYKIQVNPREVNLFYIEDGLRERIIFENGVFKINNTEKVFSPSEIKKELELSPEKFSPNVIMRPLYQEVILPNLCYIGGGGELAYWFQLKELFVKSDIVFPILLLRNSVLLSSIKKGDKISKLKLNYTDLFLKKDVLSEKIVRDCCQLDLSFEKQKNQLKRVFDELEPIALKTDITFKGALEAQKIKQLKGLLQLEKRLLKAEKRKYSDLLERVALLQESLFPRKGLQERNTNFAQFYKEHGEKLIPYLLDDLNPLELSFSVLEL